MIIIASNVIIVACLIVASVLTFDFGKPSLTAVTIFLYEIFKKNFMAPFFMDGFKLPQGYSHFKEAVYFLPFSSQTFLVLILSTSKG